MSILTREVSAVCDVCGERKYIIRRDETLYPPLNLLERGLRDEGWTVRGDFIKCPKCKRKKSAR